MPPVTATRSPVIGCTSSQPPVTAAISDCPRKTVDFSAPRALRSARLYQRGTEEGYMQAAKVVKLGMGAAMARQVEQAAADEHIAMAEIVRRALWLYFSVHPVPATVEEYRQGPAEGAGCPLRAPMNQPRRPERLAPQRTSTWWVKRPRCVWAGVSPAAYGSTRAAPDGRTRSSRPTVSRGCGRRRNPRSVSSGRASVWRRTARAAA